MIILILEPLKTPLVHNILLGTRFYTNTESLFCPQKSVQGKTVKNNN